MNLEEEQNPNHKHRQIDFDMLVQKANWRPNSFNVDEPNHLT